MKVFEALAAVYGVYQVSAATCSSWETTNGTTHPVLRDTSGPTSVAGALSMKVKDMVVLNRDLKIVFSGQVTGPFEQNQVLSVLTSNLLP